MPFLPTAMTFGSQTSMPCLVCRKPVEIKGNRNEQSAGMYITSYTNDFVTDEYVAACKTCAPHLVMGINLLLEESAKPEDKALFVAKDKLCKNGHKMTGKNLCYTCYTQG